MGWNVLNIQANLDKVLDVVQNWRNDSRSRKELRNVQPDLDLFTPAFELVIAIHSLFESFNDIINRFLDFDADWTNNQRDEVSRMITNFYSGRKRVDLIAGSIGRLETEINSQQNADRRQIIEKLIWEGKKVLEAFNAKEIRTPWNFQIVTHFLENMKAADTKEKAKEVISSSERDLNILKNNAFPEIDGPLGQLEQKILNDNPGNQVLRDQFNKLHEMTK
jgi:hypothetical protein